MSFEFSPRLAAVTLATGIGASMLTGCGAEYDGWAGCDQAMLTATAYQPREAINAGIKEHNDGAEQLDNGTMRYVDGAVEDSKDALFSLYRKVYGEDYVSLQAGDKIPYCVSKEGEISFDLGGNIEVKGDDYHFVGDKWKIAPFQK